MYLLTILYYLDPVKDNYISHTRAHARVCLYVCIYLCMNVYVYIVCMNEFMYVCMHNIVCKSITL